MTTAFEFWLQQFQKIFFVRKAVTLNGILSSKIQNDHQRPNNHQSNH